LRPPKQYGIVPQSVEESGENNANGSFGCVRGSALRDHHGIDGFG
jgi:hypothetical protein